MVLRILGVLILFNASTSVLWYDVSLSSSHQRFIFISKISAFVVQWVFVFHWSIREQFWIVNHICGNSLAGRAELRLHVGCSSLEWTRGGTKPRSGYFVSLHGCVGGSLQFLAGEVLTINYQLSISQLSQIQFPYPLLPPQPPHTHTLYRYTVGAPLYVFFLFIYWQLYWQLLYNSAGKYWDISIMDFFQDGLLIFRLNSYNTVKKGRHFISVLLNITCNLIEPIKFFFYYPKIFRFSPKILTHLTPQL